MSRLVFVLISAALIATAADAQQAAPPNRARVGVCTTARTAAARLICAEPELAARDAKVAAAYRLKKSRMPPAAQTQLLNEQFAWMRQRDEKCGLVGKDAAPLDELRKAKDCMQAELEARLVELQGTLQTDAPSPGPAANVLHPVAVAPAVAPPPPAAPSPPVNVAAPASTGQSFSQNAAIGNPDIVITSLPQSAAAGATAPSAGARQQFRFAAAASHVSGTADCGPVAAASANQPAVDAGIGPGVRVDISPIDDANSYPIFEKDAWPSLLDEIRQAFHAKCVNRSDATNNGSELKDHTTELYEVSSSRGLFVAHSAGINGAWNVEVNLPRTRKQLQSDLGIQKWIRPSELTRNPYFFKDVVVGMIVQLDRKISDKDAVFARSGAQIFVSGVPHSFTEQQMVILAGRVLGNKGVVDASGNEELMPAMDYVGSGDCAKACEAFASLVAQ